MRILKAITQCGFSADTLRCHERIRSLPPINRNKGSIRNYEEIDLKRVEFNKYMRSVGLPVEIMLKYFKLVQQVDQTIEDRKGILIEQREELAAKMDEVEKTLDFLD